MVRTVRHRQSKEAANGYAAPTATAPHLYSTDGNRAVVQVPSQRCPVPQRVVDGLGRRAAIGHQPALQLRSSVRFANCTCADAEISYLPAAMARNLSSSSLQLSENNSLTNCLSHMLSGSRLYLACQNMLMEISGSLTG